MDASLSDDNEAHSTSYIFHSSYFDYRGGFRQFLILASVYQVEHT